MKIIKENRRCTIEFSGVQEALNYGREGLEKKGGWLCQSSWKEGDNDFRGIDWKDMETGLKMGTEKRKQISDTLSKFKVEVDNRMPKRQRQFGYTGSSVCVGRAMTGNPKCMRRNKREMMPVKTVKIIWNPTASWAVSSDKIMKSGIECLKMVYILEKQGYRVQLDALGLSAKVGNTVYTSKVVLKRYEDDFNIAKLCVPLADTSWLRRLGFMNHSRFYTECCGKKVPESLGMVSPYPCEEDEYMCCVDGTTYEEHLKNLQAKLGK